MSRTTRADFVTMPTRVAKPVEHFQHGARDTVLALDRLIRIGDSSECYGLRDIAGSRQFLLEQLRCIGFRIELGLEIQPCRMPQVAVTWPGVAVDAAVLASAIGIDRAVEADVRAVVGCDDATRRLNAHLGLESLELGQAFPAVVEVLPHLRLKAAGPIRSRTAPRRRSS